VKYNKAVEKSDLKDNLSWLFVQVSFRAKQGLVRLAEEYDLTLPQLYTLTAMKPDKPFQMNEIATMLACDPSNATGIIDRLFANKYIERKENPRDRRAKMISLTPKGTKLQTEIIKRIMEYKPKAFDNLSQNEKQQLSGLLAKVLETPT
jgi:DNA-binding MarR family transcriptional regulator